MKPGSRREAVQIGHPAADVASQCNVTTESTDHYSDFSDLAHARTERKQLFGASAEAHSIGWHTASYGEARVADGSLSYPYSRKIHDRVVGIWQTCKMHPGNSESTNEHSTFTHCQTTDARVFFSVWLGVG